MSHRAFLLSIGLAIGIPAFAMAAPGAGDWSLDPIDPIAGIYVTRDGHETMRVTSLPPGTASYSYWLESSEGWWSVGFFDGRVYQGVFRYRGRIDPAMIGVSGVHAIQWNDRDAPRLYANFFDGRKAVSEQAWRRVSLSPDSVLAMDSQKPLPTPGDSVYVEELPEMIHRVAPDYPDKARKAGISGQVYIKALVLEDGTVGDLFVMQSVPGLDLAALDAVRKYRFKPARAGGKPIAVWVAIPIRFTLH